MKLLNKISTGLTVNLLMAGNFASKAFAQGQIVIPQPEEGVHDFSTFLGALIRVALILAALLTFGMLIWGGLQWILSGGDKGKYEEARGRITASLVGLAIVAAAWALMKLIGYFFGIDILSGGFTIPSAAGL